MKWEYEQTKVAKDFRKQVKDGDVHSIIIRHYLKGTKKYQSFIDKIMPEIRQHCFSFGWSPVIRAARKYTGDITTLTRIMDHLWLYNVAESIIQATLIYMQETGEVSVDFQADLENIRWITHKDQQYDDCPRQTGKQL
jgi:hypothetical protein